MKRFTILILMLTACLPLKTVFAQQETWITNASLVDPARRTIQHGMTVVFKGNLITAVHKRKAPGNAVVIDAGGKFLVPGLTDAHVHFFQSGGLYTRPDFIDLRKIRPYEEEIKEVHKGLEQQLRRYVQNGITTVFDVGTTYRLLNRRKEMTEWAVAPQVYMAGPIITTAANPAYDSLKEDAPFARATTAAEGRRLVEEQLPYKPDLIKLVFRPGGKAAADYLPVVRAVIDQAHLHGLRVAVHATERTAAQLAAEAGADFLVHSVGDEVLDDDFVALIKKKKIVVCPTLLMEDGYLHTFDQSRVFTARELTYAEPFALGSLYDLKQLPDTAIARLYQIKAAEHTPRTAAINRISQLNLKKLSDAGVTIVSGTDAGNIGTLHAVSLLPELLQMQQSGMSSWQVLQSATVNTAAILKRAGYTGNITAGQPANMLLLDGDPIADLHQLEHIHRVIRNGRVIDPDTVIHYTPASLVQRQLNAYNSRNMEAFLATYAEDAELLNFPDKLLRKGKEDLRKAYFFFDIARLLHCRIVKRITEDNYVIDEEHIVDDHGTRGGTAIYQVEKEKIKKVYFVK
ncbi:amidohydrolase family protein [Chitinophaga varians]|uniref:Amidohydrolase family protein n=1 Tax=Chitinophaga varians TaxID=2202339 RepID=A0A847RYJ1_9BACT|nr:amidohydrolase family protein [Chitinophaga varians]NLR68132.1 amidohydrolase family protein [Chitinophaga varians]